MEAFPFSKNIKILYEARFEYFEQLYQLDSVQILNRDHDKNSGTDSNLNLYFKGVQTLWGKF
jgi:hypothetical protein